jgi:hypothetical protein
MSTQITISPEIKLVVNTTPITGGSAGQILFQTTGNTVGESANLLWDNTNGIFNVVGRINAKSTTAQPSSLIVEGTTGVNSGNAGFVVRTGTGYQATFFAADNLAGQGISGLGIFTGATTPFGLQTGAPNGAFFIHNNGNIGIGTNYINAGFRLDVNGTARIVSSAVFGGEIFGPSNFYINGPSNGTGTMHLRPAILNLSTANVQYNGTQFLGTGAGADLKIGSVVSGYNSLSWHVSGAERARMFSTGNFSIGTATDAGYKLDVNGTARIVNALTLGNVVLSLSSQGGGTISCANSAGANTGSFINLSGPVFLNPTAGNSGMFAISGQYAPSSGTANFNHLNLAPILNTTGTYSGIVRGMYYNPTLTSTTGVTAHFAIHTTAGRVRFENLPTSPAGLSSGDVWNNLGILTIV